MSDSLTCECCDLDTDAPSTVCDYCAMGECSLCGGEFA